MKIKVLGAGSAFTMDGFQSNFFITSDDGLTSLLLDCGSDIRFSLAEQGLSYKDVKNIYVSHLHADHCGGLEAMAFCSHYDPSYTHVQWNGITSKKPSLFVQANLLSHLWNDTLRGGLGSADGKEMELSDYFELEPLQMNQERFIPGLAAMRIIKTTHITNDFGNVPAFGLMLHCASSKKKIYFTTDARFDPEKLMGFYQEADLIIQDCETASYKSQVHAHYTQLVTLPDEIKAKMYLVHYQDKTDRQAIQDGFKGFLAKGDLLVVEEV